MILVTTIDQPLIIGWPGPVYTALTSQCTLAAATECAAPSQSRDQLSLSSAPASGELRLETVHLSDIVAMSRSRPSVSSSGQYCLQLDNIQNCQQPMLDVLWQGFLTAYGLLLLKFSS